MSAGVSHSKAWPVYAFAAGLLALMVVVFTQGSAAAPGTWGGSNGSLSASPTATSSYAPTDTATLSPTATSTPVTLPYCWTTVPAPDQGHDWPNASMQGISALAANDIWTLASYMDTQYINHIFAVHWDGSTWSLTPIPVPPESELNDLVALSDNNVWAVGSQAGVYDQSDNLSVHWNGRQWSVVPIPRGPLWSNTLTAVDASSSTNVWAVGWGTTPQPPNIAMVPSGIQNIFRWDGQQWDYMDSGLDAYKGFSTVQVNAPNSVWVGGATGTGLFGGVLLYWDGAHWTNTIANIGDYFGVSAVAAISLTDVWASALNSLGQWVFLHSDGSHWAAISSQDLQVTHIEPASPNDIWATTGSYPYASDVLLHWDGSNWGRVPFPGDNILDIAALSSTNIWAVGSANGKMLILHYNPSCIPTPAPPATPTPAPPPCPNERFTDVCPTDYFYPYVQALADDGILSGYNTSPPCLNSLWIPCFNPYNSSTRGQISKVVSLAAGFNEPVSGQTFQDLPPGSTFYTYTQRMAERGIVSGYPCGSPSTPCVPPGNLPYFRTNNHVTRGQLSKMVSLAFGWNDPVTGQTFQDVPPGSTFYNYIGQLLNRSIINGYPCGSPSRPCIPPDNLPYFMPNNDVTRGQTAKIVQISRTQPTPTPAITATPLPTYTNGTPTDTRIATYTAVSTGTSIPDVTPTSTPACCSDVTASINSFCQGAQYWFSYSITNSCPITVTANGAYYFEVAATINGPWQARIVGDCFSCAIPPGVTQSGGLTGWSGPLPPGANWWRTHLSYTDIGGCWSFDVASTPQPACILGTATPTPVSNLTAPLTSINPICQGLPPPLDMQISSDNCEEPAGKAFGFTGSRFQPGENISSG